MTEKQEACVQTPSVPPYLARQQALMGEESCLRLMDLTVMVVGVGGVGGYVVEALARCGVGRLILVDHDTVSESNRNRQIIALRTTLGRSKTAVMSERIADINPDCRVICHETFLTPENAEALIADASPDFVVDAIDHVPGKTAIAQVCAEKGIPLIASMGTGNKLCPELLRISTIEKTSICPLARVMRRKYRDSGVERVTVLWSEELPATSGEEEGGRRVPASVAFVPSAAGLLIASALVRAVIAPQSEDGVQKYRPIRRQNCGK